MLGQIWLQNLLHRGEESSGKFISLPGRRNSTPTALFGQLDQHIIRQQLALGKMAAEPLSLSEQPGSLSKVQLCFDRLDAVKAGLRTDDFSIQRTVGPDLEVPMRIGLLDVTVVQQPERGKR